MSGYVDPSIVAGSRAEQQILAAIVARRLTLRPVRPGSKTLRLTGPDVDVLATAVGALKLDVLGSRVERTKP